MSEITPRLIGTHHHAFDNIPDAQPVEGDNAPGDVFTLDADLKPVWSPPGSATSAQDDAFIVAMAVAL